MFVNAVEIAIRVSRESGVLTSADYIEFWGEGLDTASTDTQIYWLLNGAEAGKRINSVGELQTDAPPVAQAPASSPSASSLPSSPENPANNSRAWFTGITSGVWGSVDAANVGEAQRNVDSQVITPVRDYSSDARQHSPVSNGSNVVPGNLERDSERSCR